jgi:fucose permease
MSPRTAVTIIFFLNGALFASWAARLPAIQAQHNLTKGELGIVLLGLSCGVITALALASGFISRYGSRLVTVVAGVLLACALPLLALMPNPLLLWGALFIFGAFMSTMDVAMNAQGVEVEKQRGQPTMSSLHAAFSIGGFFGAAVGAGMAGQNISPALHFSSMAVLAIGVTLWAGQSLLLIKPHKGGAGRIFQLPPRALLPLGVIAFCSTMGEGTMADWSAIYLEQIVQVSASTAALGFAVYSALMTVGRLAGDWLTQRLRADWLVRGGGAIATSGFLVAILLPQPVPVLFGFALVGAGLSIVIPLVFSAAGKMPNLPPGSGIAGVATIGYAGFLAGPPLIGAIAQVITLPAALLLIALMVSTLIFVGGAVQPTVSDHGSGAVSQGE